MLHNVGPLAAGVIAQIDGGDPNVMEIFFNCPVTKTGTVTGIAVDDVPQATITQGATESLIVDTGGALTGGERVTVGPLTGASIGPNITWATSELIALAP